MKIKIDGKNYELDIDKAKDSGALKEEMVVLELTQEEAQILKFLTGNVCGADYYKAFAPVFHKLGHIDDIPAYFAVDNKSVTPWVMKRK